MSLSEHSVVIARAAPSTAAASPAVGGVAAYERTAIEVLLAHLFADAGLDAARSRSADWNPLGELIPPGARVLVKPNWVHHNNSSGAGLESLITHATVVDVVLAYVLRARPSEVVVADAPIQGCDLPRMLAEGGYDDVRNAYAAADAPIEWRDLRRTVVRKENGRWHRDADLRPVENYVLFDVGRESLLEPISGDADRFRVTEYNPDLMRATHAPGRHQYLIAREAIDADVVINLPKLKTHKKAGITGARKNLVGINGNKDYLPHHRLGGSTTGGDCYPGGNRLKLAAELLADGRNRHSGLPAQIVRQAERATYGLIKYTGMDTNLEGSWHGNDTLWRMSLDLNRVLLYGRPDGSLADRPQRQVVSITDAIVAGEGEGPLAPTPHPLGMLTLARNSAAAELVHAHLMGLDWTKIPIVREAFGRYKYAIAGFAPDAVEVRLDGATLQQPWPIIHPRPFLPPTGWQGHCEAVRRQVVEASGSTGRRSARAPESST